MYKKIVFLLNLLLTITISSSLEASFNIRSLAKKNASVTEIGLKSTKTTERILQGLSENGQHSQPIYLGIDSSRPLGIVESAKKIADQANIDFTFWPADETTIQIEKVDMLVLNTLSTYCHGRLLLDTFAPRVRNYICIYNTGNEDDPSYDGDYREYPAEYSRNKKGLNLAIKDFLAKHSEWKVIKNYQQVTILKRSRCKPVSETHYHSKVDYFLQNKMILCTGPALRRFEQLKETTEQDMNLVPFKKIFVSTNDPTIMDITFNDQIPVLELLEDRGKQIDCTNCIISTMRNAVNDPDVKDDDIIIFKHETVYINDMELVKRAVGKMLSGTDMIIRWGKCGACTDVFLVRVSAIKAIVKDYPILTSLEGNKNCEAYFSNCVVNKVSNVHIIKCKPHSWWKFTQLGFYHQYPIPYTTADGFGCPWWDKKNYNDLFK